MEKSEGAEWALGTITQLARWVFILYSLLLCSRAPANPQGLFQSRAAPILKGAFADSPFQKYEKRSH